MAVYVDPQKIYTLANASTMVVAEGGLGGVALRGMVDEPMLRFIVACVELRRFLNVASIKPGARI